ncbi:hypothetical protein D3C81_1006650 [compost metagenome]
MVGDVAATHRQRNAVAAAAKQAGFAGGEAQQEVGQPFRRLQTGQGQGIVLRGIQFLASALQQLAFQMRVTLAQVAHLRHRHPADAALRDGLDVVAVLVGATEPHVIAGQHETTHLAAAVGQRTHQAQRTLGYGIDISTWLAGTGQRGAHRDRHRGGDLLQRLHFIAGQRRADRQVPDRAMQAFTRTIAVRSSGRCRQLLGAGGGPGHGFNTGEGRGK